MKQFRAYKALLPNKVSRKTTTGLKLGRLLDCSEADIFNIANYVYSIPGLVPRWSCGEGYAWVKNIF